MNRSKMPTVRDEPTARTARTADHTRPTAVSRATAATRPTSPTRPTGRTSAAPAPELVLDRYRLTKRLGAGAFGTVYAARDERLERDVALKLLPRERVAEGRFEREARAAARLAHPAIVTLYEAAVDDDGAYLVSELVRGRTLADLLASGRLSDQDVLRIGIALCDALEHAHAENVIHRDVKPSNVLVPARRTRDAPPAKLTDFGIARVVGGDSLTRTGDVVGTLAYMSPEQAEGRESGAASDLYSLALVLYEALTGVNPLRAARPGTRPRRLGTYLPPVRRQRRDLPRELGAALDRALRPRVGERGTIEELYEALEHCVGQVTDTPGVVEAAWVPGARTEEQEALGPEWGAAAATEVAGQRAGHPEIPRAGRLSGAAVRALAAAGAGLAIGWLSARLPGGSPLAPSMLGLTAGGAALLLPRLGFAVAMLGLVILAATAGGTGFALLLLGLLAATVLLLPRRGVGWSVPALAVGLGLAGLGLAWPALTARLVRGAWRRAALSGLGLLWLLAGSDLIGHSLLWRPARTPGPLVLGGSLPVALHDVIVPQLRGGGAICAVAWGVAACLGAGVWAVRPVALRVALAVAGAAGLALVTEAVGLTPLHGVVLASVLGAAVLAAPGRSGSARIRSNLRL